MGFLKSIILIEFLTKTIFWGTSNFWIYDQSPLEES